MPSIHPSLPDDLRNGVALLGQRPPPSRLQDASAWPQVVSDAQLLVRDGWAANALALGWKGRDLFGVAVTGSEDFEGLAVWLRGRTLLLIEAECAVVRDGGGRAYFNRGGWGHGKDYAGEVVPLWRFGRG